MVAVTISSFCLKRRRSCAPLYPAVRLTPCAHRARGYGMGDDDRAGQQLPHRARGPAEAKSARAASPSLSAETRQRMQAAVESERARATGQDQEPAGPARGAIAPGPAGHGGPAPSTSQNQPSPPIQPVTPEPAVYPLPAAVAPVTGRPRASRGAVAAVLSPARSPPHWSSSRPGPWASRWPGTSPAGTLAPAARLRPDACPGAHRPVAARLGLRPGQPHRCRLL